MHRLIKGLVLAVPLLLLLAACDNPSSGQPAGTAAVVGGTAGDTGLVAWWKFDEGDGVTAHDASGNGNTATLRNGGWSGKALHMNGGNKGIVVVPLSDSLRSTADSVTVMGWAYRTAQHNVDLVGHGYPYLFLGFHGARFKWQIANTRGKTLSCYADRKYRAVTDHWFHLAGTYDGRTLRLYVDGVEICSAWTWLSSPIAMPDAPFTISGYMGDTGEIIDEITGDVDDVRIYNRALDAAAVAQVFHAGR